MNIHFIWRWLANEVTTTLTDWGKNYRFFFGANTEFWVAFDFRLFVDPLKPSVRVYCNGCHTYAGKIVKGQITMYPIPFFFCSPSTIQHSVQLCVCVYLLYSLVLEFSFKFICRAALKHRHTHTKSTLPSF